jgi:SAM-dependent methyltransferase
MSYDIGMQDRARSLNAVNYSSALLEREFGAREPIRLALLSLIETYAIQRREVAELGSGLGYNLELFSGANHVIGVEGLATAAEAATARGVTTIAADLALPVPLPSDSVDVVLCLDVLEHLLDPGLCLNEAHRILRPDGLVVVNVPNHFNLSGRFNIARGAGIDSVHFFPEHADWDYPHVRFFRRSSIIDLIGRCGFRLQADWTERFPSVPVLSRFAAFQRSAMARCLARRAPDLFAGGFFIIARKPVPGAGA